jgi:hypothetical protein
MDIEVEWADPRKRSYQVHRETFSKWVTTLRRALEYAEPRYSLTHLDLARGSGHSDI